MTVPPATTRISNARLADGRLVDIDVDHGVISAVSTAGAEVDVGAGRAAAGAAVVHDLDGWLLLPAMAEPHAHLDKALTADLVPNPAGDLRGAIDAWVGAAAAGRITSEDTVDRATTAMEMLLVHGVTAVRTHVNVGQGYGATAVEAVNEARARIEPLMAVQTVALVQSPLTGAESSGHRAALDQAIEAGVDLLGGCPHLEPDGPAMIR